MLFSGHTSIYNYISNTEELYYKLNTYTPSYIIYILYYDWFTLIAQLWVSFKLCSSSTFLSRVIHRTAHKHIIATNPARNILLLPPQLATYYCYLPQLTTYYCYHPKMKILKGQGKKFFFWIYWPNYDIGNKDFFIVPSYSKCEKCCWLKSD